MYVILALLAAALSGIGAALMKFGVAVRFPRITLATFLREWPSVVRAVAGSRVWLLGLLLGVSSGFFMAQAMAGGDLAVVQVIGTTTSLWSVAIGVLFFSERLDPGEWKGLAVILAGAGLVSLAYAPTQAATPAVDRLAVITAVIVLGAALSWVANRGTGTGVSPELLLSMYAGFGFGLVNVFMKLATWQAADAAGSFHVLSAASWAHLVSHAPFWCMLASIVPGFVLLQAAFAHGRVAVVMPLHLVFINLTAIFCALVVFREDLNAMRGLGIACGMGGAGILAYHSARARARERRTVE